jgi:hypothetical protein
VYGRFVPRADIVVGDGWRGKRRRRGMRHLRKELICHDTGWSSKTCEEADYDDISRRSAISWSISFNDVYLVVIAEVFIISIKVPRVGTCTRLGLK